jgi:hypothetical protein
VSIKRQAELQLYDSELVMRNCGSCLSHKTYGTIPRTATVDGIERIPKEVFSAIMTTNRS